MFYGRVDVYWPDGPVESYRLNKSTIAIGRSTGNDIALESTAISRYHVTLTFRDQQVFLEDLESVNGTYVDGVRLAPNAPLVLRGGEELQIGEIRLIFHPPLEEATAPMAGDATQRVVLAQPTYRLELDGPEMAVAPGAHVKARLAVENLGDQTDRYSIDIDGLPKGWARLDRAEMEVEPGEQGQAMISLKPLRRSESQPGSHPFVVRVRSQSKPSETIDAPTALQVLPYSGFGMALGSARVGDRERFQLYIHNQGNAPLTLTIQGTDPEQALKFELSGAQFQLGPGERQTMTGAIRPRRRRLFGAEREREFAVVARAHDASGFLATVPGVYVERGLLPLWTVALIAPLVALVALVVVGVFLLVFGGSEKDPGILPTIAAFDVSPQVVSLGATADVSWTVSDATALTLLAGRGDTQQRYDLAPDAASFVLTFDDSGAYALTLIAQNDTLEATARATVEVRPSVSLQIEAVNGGDLVRNVQQEVLVKWVVNGAREFDGQRKVWLESSDRLIPLVPAPLPPSGQNTVLVTPVGDQAAWLVTLYAEGQDSVEAQITQQIAIVPPSCALSVAQTVARSGPGDAYPTVGLPLESASPENSSQTPLARDPSGDWLQVTLAGETPQIGWVPRRDFVCSNFDPARLVVTDNFPPLPTLTPPPGETTAVTPAPATPNPSPLAETVTPGE